MKHARRRLRSAQCACGTSGKAFYVTAIHRPAARTDPASPIYGTPILDVDKSKDILVVERGRGTGFAGVENALFATDNTRMLFGDAQDVANALVSAVKKL